MSLLMPHKTPFNLQQFKQTKRNAVSLFRTRLNEARDTLKKAFFADISTAAMLIKAYANFIDFLLQSAWALHIDSPEQICLIAIGGYGRSELHPYSDIDLLVLSHDQTDEKTQISIEAFIIFLWDIGLEIGHSVHDVKSCAALASTDLTVITNLTETRFLQGNIELFHRLIKATNTEHMWPSQDFYHAKLNEKKIRHQKYDNVAYKLEPNIKNSPGGLRDLHFIAWTVKRHFAVPCLEAAIQFGFLSKQTYQALITDLHFLWQVRYALHLIAERHEDRLWLDYQLQLSHVFGYCDDEQNQAIDKFMQRCFQTFKRLSTLYELLNQRLVDLQHFPKIMTIRESICFSELRKVLKKKTEFSRA